MSAQRVIARLRVKLQSLSGVSVFLVPTQDVRIGARQGRSDYQFTLWSPDLLELRRVAPLVADQLRSVPGIVDVNSDQEAGGLQADVLIDRSTAAQLRVGVQDIVSALNDVYAQRQIAVIYGERNQYRVVLAVEPRLGATPDDLKSVYVPTKSAAGSPSRLPAPAGRRRRWSSTIGQFAAVTISYSLAPGVSIGEATPAIRAAVAAMALPESVHSEFAGDAAAFARSANDQTLLIVAALVAIYILLGVLYESLVHPLTILSTLPSAGLGALLTLKLTGTDLTIVAFIGIILLINNVKKNGIMLVDHALDLQSRNNLDAQEAIVRAACERFRPILMTTLAAMLGRCRCCWGGPGLEPRRHRHRRGRAVVSQVLSSTPRPPSIGVRALAHGAAGGGPRRARQEVGTPWELPRAAGGRERRLAMPPIFSLALTLLSLAPPELIAVAARTGYQQVSRACWRRRPAGGHPMQDARGWPMPWRACATPASACSTSRSSASAPPSG